MWHLTFDIRSVSRPCKLCRRALPRRDPPSSPVGGHAQGDCVAGHALGPGEQELDSSASRPGDQGAGTEQGPGSSARPEQGPESPWRALRAGSEHVVGRNALGPCSPSSASRPATVPAGRRRRRCSPSRSRFLCEHSFLDCSLSRSHSPSVPSTARPQGRR